MWNRAHDESIRTLGHELHTEALVIAEDFETPFSLGDLAQYVQVVEELPEEAIADRTELFLLNLRAPRAGLLASRWLERGASRVHYWATLESWQLIVDFLDNSNALQVVDVSYEGRWIKLEISVSTEQTIQKQSFLIGLSVMSAATSREVTRNPEPRLTEPTFRGLLINKVLPIAKPLKRFIPHRLVIMLYKILEKLR